MTPVTDISQLKSNKLYSYADYLTWNFEQAVELIRGRVWRMSPAPRTNHQRISRNLNKFLVAFFEETNCESFYAPFDVRLFDEKKSVNFDDQIYTVVQPDLCIICDKNKIDELGCVGAPDLVVEILSKGNSRKEMRVKYKLYESAGVREYWIADPERETVHVFFLDENKQFQLDKIYLREDILQSYIFNSLKIDLNMVFVNNQQLKERLE